MKTITSLRSASVAVAVLSGTTPSDGHTATIGGVLYTFKSTLGTTPGNVLIGTGGTALADTLAHLAAAVNGTAGAGSTYVATVSSPGVTVVATATTVTVQPGISAAVVATGGALTWAVTPTTVAPNANDVVMVAAVADQAPVMNAQQSTVRNTPASNVNWPRSVRAGNVAVSIVRAGANSFAWLTSVLAQVAVLVEQTLTWTPAIITGQPTSTTAVHSSTSGTFTVTAISEMTLAYAWYESATGTSGWGSALTTAGIYNVSTAGTLVVTPSGAGTKYYKCTVTDSAGGVVTSSVVSLITS